MLLVGAQRRTPTERVLAWLLATAAAEFALLAVTGAYLIFFYRPTAAQSWGLVPSQHAPVAFPDMVRLVHRLTSLLFILTLLVVAAIAVALAVARTLRTRRHGMSAAATIGMAMIGMFASFTGVLLPWDQLALRAVTIGTNFGGYRFLWSPAGKQVQYVLIRHATISANTLRAWLLVHVLIVPVVLVALGLVAGWRLLRPRDEPNRHSRLGS